MHYSWFCLEHCECSRELMILQTLLLSSSSMIHVLHQCPFSGLFCGKLWFFPLSLSPNIHRFWSQLLFFFNAFFTSANGPFWKILFHCFFSEISWKLSKFLIFFSPFFKKCFFFLLFFRIPMPWQVLLKLSKDQDKHWDCTFVRAMESIAPTEYSYHGSLQKVPFTIGKKKHALKNFETVFICI